MESGKVEQFKQQSKFESLKNFNSNMEQWWIDIHQNKLLTKSEIIALKRLIRFACKIPGICYAKIQTIVAATHEFDGIGISRRTFERMLTKVKDLGLVEVINTYKANGKQSHNVYVFLPYQPVIPTNEKIDVANKSINLSKSSIHDKEIRTEGKPVIIPDWVNKEFANFATYFFQPNQIEELWKVTYIHSKQFAIPSSNLSELSINSLKVLISKMKGKSILNPIGFFNGVMKRKFKAYYMRELFDSVFDT
ncbi:hypothetical protein [Mesobacillus foraminis]|uniref:Uncharacterized protein n=1 Tax=Mesobacillus foraminis TaxID=279826 RepID=A0A4R2BEX2_9BACI|nr:hypothetical protein [Mesobacillus foraminis]TCN25511.1 hypothetical protein EV146_105168 [Mesobacillus foraminis]